MIKSMTGYGKAQASLAAKTITIELRGLNSKQLDLGVKLPQPYRAIEPEVRGTISCGAVRGKVDLYVTVTTTAGGAAGAARINGALFADYYRQLLEAADGAGMAKGELNSAVVAAALVRLPDVVSVETDEAPEDETRALLGALAEALGAFDTFRAQEGAVLAADILARVDEIGKLLAEVEPFEKARVAAVRERILDNVASLSVTVDPNRLEQELIFWVEKLDVTEEKVRLAKHLDYFRTTARSEAEAGRKLGFIAQEMGREINTLGSKASDAEMQKIVVRMKDELEKIKEQLLNIL